MSQEPKLHSRIRYEYSQEPQARLQLAHGVWGGINPQGEIEMNFYSESDKIPPFSERLVEPDGTLGHEMVPFDETIRTITRTVHSRVVLNYYTARALVEWLEDKIDTLDLEDGGTMIMDDKAGVEQ